MRLFEIIDKSGRKIYVTNERWSHIASEHPAIADKIEDIKDTLSKPLTVTQSENNPKIKFF